jgi:hypothetical protein
MPNFASLAAARFLRTKMRLALAVFTGRGSLSVMVSMTCSERQHSQPLAGVGDEFRRRFARSFCVAATLLAHSSLSIHQ